MGTVLIVAKQSEESVFKQNNQPLLFPLFVNQL